MKTIIVIAIASYLLVCCDQSGIKKIIVEEKQEWIHSWENDPLAGFQGVKEWQSFEKINYYDGYGKRPGFEPFYSYSPSKTLFVDIYSRTLLIETDNGENIISFLEPESEIVLFDTIQKTAYSLEFVGSNTYYEDTIWVSDSCFVVVGYRVHYENSKIYNPLIIFYDLKNMKRFYYEGSSNRRKYEYFEKKFPTVNLK